MAIIRSGPSRFVGDDVAQALAGDDAERAVVDVAGLAWSRVGYRGEHEEVGARPPVMTSTPRPPPMRSLPSLPRMRSPPAAECQKIFALYMQPSRHGVVVMIGVDITFEQGRAIRRQALGELAQRPEAARVPVPNVVDAAMIGVAD